MSPLVSEWFALRVVARRELTVAEVIEEERKATVYLPLETAWGFKRGLATRTRVHVPLYPGYLFVLGGDGAPPPLGQVEGVIGYVNYSSGDGRQHPMPFPAREILRLQMDVRAGVYDSTRSVRPPPYRPRKGDSVKIVAGPYFGAIAKVLNATADDRYKLLIEGFGKPRRRTEDRAHLVAA